MFWHKQFILPGLFLFIVVLVGTWGYWLIREKQYSLLDCRYMTIITISTIGFSEIVAFAATGDDKLFGQPRR